MTILVIFRGTSTFFPLLKDMLPKCTEVWRLDKNNRLLSVLFNANQVLVPAFASFNEYFEKKKEKNEGICTAELASNY